MSLLIFSIPYVWLRTLRRIKWVNNIFDHVSLTAWIVTVSFSTSALENSLSRITPVKLFPSSSCRRRVIFKVFIPCQLKLSFHQRLRPSRDKHCPISGICIVDPSSRAWCKLLSLRKTSYDQYLRSEWFSSATSGRSWSASFTCFDAPLQSSLSCLYRPVWHLLCFYRDLLNSVAICRWPTSLWTACWLVRDHTLQDSRVQSDAQILPLVGPYRVHLHELNGLVLLGDERSFDIVKIHLREYRLLISLVVLH